MASHSFVSTETEFEVPEMRRIVQIRCGRVHAGPKLR